MINFEKKRETRSAAFAQAALSAIARMGLDKVKLTDIASEAGVTTGAVTYYFRDKDALLVAAFEEVSKKLFSRNSKDWAVNNAEEMIAVFTNTLPTNEPRLADWKVWLAFCGRAAFSEDISRVYKRFYSSYESALADKLPIKCQERAREVAGAVIAAIDGVGLCAVVHPELWPEERQENRLRELLAPLCLEFEKGS